MRRISSVKIKPFVNALIMKDSQRLEMEVAGVEPASQNLPVERGTGPVEGKFLTAGFHSHNP